jgi:tetratricopeptide (TPR) repeat protein
MYYQRATQIEPACASAWHNWGLLCMTSAKHSLEGNLQTCLESLNYAKQYFMNSLVHFGHHPIFLNRIARWHERYVTLLENLVDKNEEICGNYHLAIKYYQAALAHGNVNDAPFKNIVISNLVECWTQYGHHLYKLGNYKEAFAIYLAVLEKEDAHISALNQAGMCLFKQDQYQNARVWFSLIIERTKDAQDQADAWLNIACCYRLESNFEKAQEAIIKAKELAPTDSFIDEEEKNIISALKKHQ